MNQTKIIVFVSVVLGIVLVVGLSNQNGSGIGRAAPASDFTYDLTGDGKGVKIVGYTGRGGAVVIPAKIEGYPVVEIKIESKRITSVVIPSSVKLIGMSSFSDNNNLTSVTIQGTGVVLEPWAFGSCINLTELKIPNGDNVLLPASPLDYIEVLAGAINAFAKTPFSNCKKLPLAMRARLKAMGFDQI